MSEVHLIHPYTTVTIRTVDQDGNEVPGRIYVSNEHMWGETGYNFLMQGLTTKFIRARYGAGDIYDYYAIEPHKLSQIDVETNTLTVVDSPDGSTMVDFVFQVE